MGLFGQSTGTGLGRLRPRVISNKIAALVSILADTVFIQDQDSENKLDLVTLGTLNTMPIALYDDSGSQTGLAGNPLRTDPTGTTTQPVTGTFYQETQPVSGTFFQETQPINGTVTANAGTNLNTSALLLEATFTGKLGEVQATPTANTLLARIKAIEDGQLADDHNVTVSNASIAVTGTFYPGTQPVSGTFFQETQPVSGTFYQETQPVSGTFYQVTQPVSGTFYQETQPVSGTVTTTPSVEPKTILSQVISQNTTGVTEIIAAVADKKIYIVGISIYNNESTGSNDTIVRLLDVTTYLYGDENGGVYLSGRGAPFQLDWNNDFVYFTIDTNHAFNIHTPSAQRIAGIVWYYQE